MVTPTETGFGTRLIARTFAAQNGGHARIDYLPEGLRCVVELLLSQPRETELLDFRNA